MTSLEDHRGQAKSKETGMIPATLSTQEVEKFNGRVRLMKEEDLPAVREILEMWVRDPETGLDHEELDQDMKNLVGSLDGTLDRTNFVAETPDGQVIGTMGFASPKNELLPFSKTEKPGELVNAYVHRDYQGGKGVGTALLNAVESLARSKGCTEVILDSGPRHVLTGHPFYIRMGYEKAGVIPNYYGPGAHTTVFRREI